MKNSAAFAVKSQRVRLALLSVLITVAAGCADDDGDDAAASATSGAPEFNVKVITVNADGDPFETSYFSWGYVDSDGNRPNPFEVACADAAEKCSERLLGFEVDGEVRLYASARTHEDPVNENGAPGCVYGLEGDASMDADPTIEQTVRIVVDQEWSVCP